ncbi:MAG TPA: CNNM domain-containing protein [Candidatus Acidoferrum sp.]|nr:CNNM domain-containing protein [Candidatus Acidoferrum sp.]
MSSIFTIVMLAGLGLSFFFSGMEAGVFALSQLRIRRLMRSGNPNARVLYRFLAAPEDFLWTIFVGNTVSNFVLVSFVVFRAHEWLRNHPVLFALVFTLGILMFYCTCELLPKMLFRTYPNRFCLFLARPFRWIHWMLKPLVAIVRWLASGMMQWSGGRTFKAHLFGNRDELRHLMQESAKGFSSEERSMIERVLDLQSLRVGHVMVPMTKAFTVTTKTRVSEATAICRERGTSRLPVWHEQGGGRRIVGLFNLRSSLYSKEELEQDRTIKDYLQPATFVDVDTRLEEAMRHLQRTGQRLAIVLSRDRRELGILSLQDILKAIFGQVRL